MPRLRSGTGAEPLRLLLQARLPWAWPQARHMALEGVFDCIRLG